ncbi:hypothetical protein AAVH_32454 [Aphelenchoides avenae]|nr:hypothetical protein AAVH_32454 [Aphelenchus avenae]
MRRVWMLKCVYTQRVLLANRFRVHPRISYRYFASSDNENAKLARLSPLKNVQTLVKSKAWFRANLEPLNVSAEDEGLLDWDYKPPSERKAKTYRQPEMAFARLYDRYERNASRSSTFMCHALLPLEQHKKYAEMLRENPSYVPELVRMCGKTMAKVAPDHRMRLLSRLLKALRVNDIPLSMAVYNAVLEVSLQNEHPFEADEAIKVVETLKLAPDAEFFNQLLWRTAMFPPKPDSEGAPDIGTRQLASIERWRNEMERRGFTPTLTSELARIYAAEFSGHEQLSESLTRIIVDSYPTYAKDVRCTLLQAAAAGGNLERLRHHLGTFETSNGTFEVPTEPLFEVIWTLSKKDPEGNITLDFIKEIIKRSLVSADFHSHCAQQFGRHLAAQHFSVAALLVRWLHENHSPKLDARTKQNNSQLRLEYFIQSALSSGMSLERLKEMKNDLVGGSSELNIYRNALAQSIISYRGYASSLERFRAFSFFIDELDLSRKKIDVMWSLVAQSEQPTEKLEILSRCLALGYKVKGIGTSVVKDELVKPLISQLEKSGKHKDYFECLDKAANLLTSGGIPTSMTHKILRDVSPHWTPSTQAAAEPARQTTTKPAAKTAVQKRVNAVTRASSPSATQESKTSRKDEATNEQRASTNTVSGRYLGLGREQFEALQTKVIDTVRAQKADGGRFRFYDNLDSAVEKLLEEGIPQEVLYRMVRRIAPNWKPPSEASTTAKPQRYWPKSISVVVSNKKTISAKPGESRPPATSAIRVEELHFDHEQDQVRFATPQEELDIQAPDEMTLKPVQEIRLVDREERTDNQTYGTDRQFELEFDEVLKHVSSQDESMTAPSWKSPTVASTDANPGRFWPQSINVVQPNEKLPDEVPLETVEKIQLAEHEGQTDKLTYEPDLRYKQEIDELLEQEESKRAGKLLAGVEGAVHEAGAAVQRPAASNQDAQGVPEVVQDGPTPPHSLDVNLERHVDNRDLQAVEAVLSASAGFPAGTDVDALAEPILQLYLARAEWAAIERLLDRM